MSSLALAKQQGNDFDGLYRQISSQFEEYKSKVADKDTLISHMNIHIQRLESQLASAPQAPAARRVEVALAPVDKERESIVNAIVAQGKKLKTLEIGDVEIAYIGDDVYLRMEQGNNPHAESISKIAKKEFKYDKYVYYVINQSAIKVN